MTLNNNTENTVRRRADFQTKTASPLIHEAVFFFLIAVAVAANSSKGRRSSRIQ
jgi:hypothetical protein